MGMVPFFPNIPATPNPQHSLIPIVALASTGVAGGGFMILLVSNSYPIDSEESSNTP